MKRKYLVEYSEETGELRRPIWTTDSTWTTEESARERYEQLIGIVTCRIVTLIEECELCNREPSN